MTKCSVNLGIRVLLSKPYTMLFKTDHRQQSFIHLNFRFETACEYYVFLWLVMWKSTLTMDNLMKRGWDGDLQYMFCGLEEIICHLFLHAP